MGIFSPSMSITQYSVKGSVAEPIIEQVRDGLSRFAIHEIDNETSEKSTGWTPFSQPYSKEFDSEALIFGTYFIFSLRIDKKNIPAALIKKQMAAAQQTRISEGAVPVMAAGEKKRLKDAIMDGLCQRIPATPNVYDVVWNHEKKMLFFFSNLKAANETLEAMFYKTFQLTLVRLFPYTIAELFSNLSDGQRDRLNTLGAKPFA